MSNCKNKADEENRLMFKVYVEDLRFWKKQQWHVLYLTLAGIGALTTFGLTLGCCFGRFSVSLFCFVLCTIEWKFLYEYYKSIMESRKKKEEILLTFEKGARDIDGISGVRGDDANQRDLVITLMFCFIGLIAWVIATLALGLK